MTIRKSYDQAKPGHWPTSPLPEDDTATGEGRSAETDEKNRGIGGDLNDINPNRQRHEDDVKKGVRKSG